MEKLVFEACGLLLGVGLNHVEWYVGLAGLSDVNVVNLLGVEFQGEIKLELRVGPSLDREARDCLDVGRMLQVKERIRSPRLKINMPKMGATKFKNQEQGYNFSDESCMLTIGAAYWTCNQVRGC